MIWFQHFHKCAGTFFIEAALKAGFETLPESANGNPSRYGKAIPLWDFTADELSEWMEEAFSHPRRLVCTEWGYPEPEPILSRKGLRFAAVIRDPWKRFFSNYQYDLRCAYTDARSIHDYYDQEWAWTKPNYYTRLLARKHTERLEQADGEAALERLRFFSHLYVQEEPDFTDRVLNALGLEKNRQTRKKANKPSMLNPRMLAWAIRRGDARKAFNSLLSLVRNEDYERFKREHFDPQNDHDAAVYAEAVRTTEKTVLPLTLQN